MGISMVLGDMKFQMKSCIKSPVLIHQICSRRYSTIEETAGCSCVEKCFYRSLPSLSLFVKSMSSNFDLYMPYRTFFCDICHTRGSPGTCFFLCGLTWKDEKFRLNLISWTWVVVKLNTWITKGFLSQVAYVKLLEASTLVFFRLTCYKTTETSLLQDLQLSLPL